MRNNRIRTTALAATALLAALSLTACNGTEDGAMSGPSTTASDSAATDTGKETGKDTQGTGADTDSGTDSKSPAENTASGSKNSTGSTSGRKSDTNGQSSTTGNSSKSPVTCTGSNTKVTVTKVSRPINHLLLTATNTGSGPCYAYHAPALRFDDAQAAFPVLRDSIPQAVVTLEPGQSAYASIGLSGEPDGQELHKGTHLSVYFTGKANQGSTGAPAELTLPAGTSWGDNGFVTYWQSEMDAALTY
ncbi:DUF4232 domain-containing protein [Streptomyces sp. NBC_00378]|uniref:DUF4232 domain-containing protein n=1 Tax=unclassified Streptomyces TaxID=2593676 RepID=UPI002258D143|nr:MULTISPECIES: DUF4232 domain-containing protein [unclassified Streptomyces]MCX5111261.1 DUF4232 domain-containing protein [Streptomyces sp. NBC_00378]